MITNFAGEVWAKEIQRQRDRYCVGVINSDRSFEGDAIEFGKQIKVCYSQRPAVKNYTIGSNIESPETLDDSVSTISIDKMKYINFLVDDVDELQSRPDMLANCMKESAAAIAEDADDAIYSLHASAATTITGEATAATVASFISDAAKALYENNVPMNEELYLEVSPAVYQKLWLAKVLRTPLSEETYSSGYVGMVDNFKVFMTNGVKYDSVSGIYHCIARTKKAIAFVGQMKKMEAYRPQGMFADAVKGLHVYGLSVIRPKEMVRLSLSVGDEPASI